MMERGRSLGFDLVSGFKFLDTAHCALFTALLSYFVWVIGT